MILSSPFVKATSSICFKMRSRANWQSAQPGVMLYMPATHVSIEGTENPLSQLSVADDMSQGHFTASPKDSSTDRKKAIKASCRTLAMQFCQPVRRSRASRSKRSLPNQSRLSSLERILQRPWRTTSMRKCSLTFRPLPYRLLRQNSVQTCSLN